jgi:hypothetical protein
VGPESTLHTALPTLLVLRTPTPPYTCTIISMFCVPFLMLACTAFLFDPEDGCSMFLQNINKLLIMVMQ